MDIGLTRDILATVLAHAEAVAPAECCGLLLGEPDRITEARPAANVARDPLRHFEIDPQALVDAHRAARAGGPALLGYYHSHPGGRITPSATDRAGASGDGHIWAIIAGGELRCWRDTSKGFVALSTRLLPG